VRDKGRDGEDKCRSAGDGRYEPATGQGSWPVSDWIELRRVRGQNPIEQLGPLVRGHELIDMVGHERPSCDKTIGGGLGRTQSCLLCRGNLDALGRARQRLRPGVDARADPIGLFEGSLEAPAGAKQANLERRHGTLETLSGLTARKLIPVHEPQDLCVTVPEPIQCRGDDLSIANPAVSSNSLPTTASTDKRRARSASCLQRARRKSANVRLFTPSSHARGGSGSSSRRRHATRKVCAAASFAISKSARMTA
jgi:hypothetical protein